MTDDIAEASMIKQRIIAQLSKSNGVVDIEGFILSFLHESGLRFSAKYSSFFNFNFRVVFMPKDWIL